MSESFCGKSCEACIQKAQYGCSGCQSGPGKPGEMKCWIAKCCAGSELKSCQDCDSKYDCVNYKQRDQMPEIIKRNAYITGRNEVLSKWLTILFWVVIVQLVATNIFSENLFSSAPAVVLFGKICSALCMMVYGLVLLRLKEMDDQYYSAGICGLIGAVCSVINVFIPAEMEALAVILSIALLIVSLVAKYIEYLAHAAIVADEDENLSQAWSSLWVWYIGMHVTMIVSVLFSGGIPLLSLVAIAALIGIMVVGIIEIVYLYRTANVFKYRIP